MVKKHPLDETFDKAIKDLQDGVQSAMLDLQQGVQECLTRLFDLEEILKIIEGMGLPNIAKIKGGSIPGFDPYKMIGLDRNATDEEVKKRYNALLHKLHPDVSGVKGTEFLTQMVVLAHDMIAKERGWG